MDKNPRQNADPRRATLQLRVRLWFVAWIIWACAVGLTWSVNRSMFGPGICTVLELTAYCVAFAAVVASMRIRECVIRGDDVHVRGSRTYCKQTAALTCAWSLACVVAVAGAVLAAESLTIALSASAISAFLLNITPPKMTPDVDPA